MNKEEHLEPSQTSKLEFFYKNAKPLTVFAKSFILDI